MFADEVRIFAVGGKGGDGTVSFHREKYRPKGGPDGGDGGHGGSVVLVADRNTGDLGYLRDHPHQRAAPGSKGASNKRRGADAGDLEVRVPFGTVVKDEAGTVLADLATEGERFVAARGGRGGRGNAAFLGQKRRAPGFAELGEPGREVWLTLELQLIADAAVVGFPNAGKSTLVAAVSAADPKIADYPFTTLEPTLGVVQRGEERFTICDIPGLIEGAAEGKGLGLRFLRHAERASVFIHLIDLSTEREPAHDHAAIRRELTSYDETLADRPEIVVLSKMDTVSEEKLESARGALAAAGIEALAISATDGRGLDELISRVFEETASAAAARPAREGYRLYRTQPDDVFDLSREGSAWRLRGGAVERWVAMTDLSNPEAVAHLQHRLERAGVEGALEEGGASPGDEVRVGDSVFEWWPSAESSEDGEGEGGDQRPAP